MEAAICQLKQSLNLYSQLGMDAPQLAIWCLNLPEKQCQEAPISQSCNLSKLQFVKAAICQSWNLSKLQFVKAAICQSCNLSQLQFAKAVMLHVAITAFWICLNVFSKCPDTIKSGIFNYCLIFFTLAVSLRQCIDLHVSWSSWKHISPKCPR